MRHPVVWGRELNGIISAVHFFLELSLILRDNIFREQIIFAIANYFTDIQDLVQNSWRIILTKVIMQGKLFQRCTHLLYCSVLSLGGNVNTRRMLQPDMGFIFHKKNQWKILVYRKLLCELSKLSKLNASILLGY